MKTHSLSWQICLLPILYILSACQQPLGPELGPDKREAYTFLTEFSYDGKFRLPGDTTLSASAHSFVLPVLSMEASPYDAVITGVANDWENIEIEYYGHGGWIECVEETLNDNHAVRFNIKENPKAKDRAAFVKVMKETVVNGGRPCTFYGLLYILQKGIPEDLR